METKAFRPSWAPASPTAGPSGTCSSTARLDDIARRLESIERTLLHLNYYIQSATPAPSSAPAPQAEPTADARRPTW
jgi:hypothetical protein